MESRASRFSQSGQETRSYATSVTELPALAGNRYVVAAAAFRKIARTALDALLRAINTQMNALDVAAPAKRLHLLSVNLTHGLNFRPFCGCDTLETSINGNPASMACH
jgi:hypothetical protein